MVCDTACGPVMGMPQSGFGDVEQDVSLSKPKYSWYLPCQGSFCVSQDVGSVKFLWIDSFSCICLWIYRQTKQLFLGKPAPKHTEHQRTGVMRVKGLCTLQSPLQWLGKLQGSGDTRNPPEFRALGRHLGYFDAFREDPAALPLNSVSLIA